ncbi:MAG: ABC transporter ATP-binding protein [Candidatus Azotimanducaceae bacterium]|uniref:ATP-binding cassette domain-containing protein n=1 Tax=OM182 bacterium TaxID=2510334 RepID=A0A520S0A4_9GAMM|nr:lipoprotein-releasing system ATP-binding protein LolD [Gammaproteobacteria bacterium]RZO75900.1 MAG: ATP-binding cassette domain-containing protein [OM182 bacterium]
MNHNSSILSVNSVHKSFIQGEKIIEVLKGVNLEVNVGERVGIVGLSGSGKSTLLHILGGLERSDSGDILIDGKNIAQLKDFEVNHMRNSYLGFVYQFHHLLPDFTALENVSLPPLIGGKSKKHANFLARKILHKVGLEHREDHRPGELSGGERQRVAIARALVNEPTCILADEPTGNLDEKTARDVNEMIISLSDQLDTSFLIVTHNSDLARRMDRVVQLQNGILSEK